MRSFSALDVVMMRKLMGLAERLADGHLTILKFTTNWRIEFGTIAWDTDLIEWRETIEKMPVGSTFSKAAKAAIGARGMENWQCYTCHNSVYGYDGGGVP